MEQDILALIEAKPGSNTAAETMTAIHLQLAGQKKRYLLDTGNPDSCQYIAVESG